MFYMQSRSREAASSNIKADLEYDGQALMYFVCSDLQETRNGMDLCGEYLQQYSRPD